MGVIAEIGSSYRIAVRHIWVFTAVYLSIRLVVAALIVPLGGLLLAAAISMSDQDAITDQDIVRFVTTPAGLAGLLALASLQISASVLDIAVMTATIRESAGSARSALFLGAGLLRRRFLSLLWFALAFVLRCLAIAVPFLLAAAGVAFVALGEYDVNYYLTHRPPQFVVAAALAAVIVAAGALLLLRQLTGWAIALHLVLFRRYRPPAAFVESRSRLSGHRMRVLWLVLSWAAVRVAAGASVTAATAALINLMPGGTNLGLVASATVAILLCWSVANVVVAALSNGALAVLLDRLYRKLTADLPETAAAPAARPSGPPLAATLAVAAIVLGAGLILGGVLLERLDRPRTVEVIAHRGAAGARPENTMAAVVKAVEDRADWVEIDVQETADGEVVVAHDSDFMKLAGVNLKVWNATMADLAEIDIGSWYDATYSDQRTPTLHEVLRAVQGKAGLIIELKYYGHDEDLEARVARIVDEAGAAEDVAVMSLKYQGVQKMRQIRPEWRYGVLAAKAIGDLTRLDADFLAVNTGQASLQLVRRAHARGKKVYVWTVDDPITMSRMISMGVDGLITNEPALARTVMDVRNDLPVPARLSLWLADRFRIGSFDLVVPEEEA